MKNIVIRGVWRWQHLRCCRLCNISANTNPRKGNPLHRPQRVLKTPGVYEETRRTAHTEYVYKRKAYCTKLCVYDKH